MEGSIALAGNARYLQARAGRNIPSCTDRMAGLLPLVYDKVYSTFV